MQTLFIDGESNLERTIQRAISDEQTKLEDGDFLQQQVSTLHWFIWNGVGIFISKIGATGQASIQLDQILHTYRNGCRIGKFNRHCIQLHQSKDQIQRKEMKLSYF